MSLIPQVKCGRCDRTYSGLRSRCPYCGAHRHKKGKRVSDGDNATWKLIIGILLIVVLIAAVVVILVTGSTDDPEQSRGKPNTSDGVNDLPGNSDPSTNPAGTQLAVTLSDGSAASSVTAKAGDEVQLTVTVTPDTVTDKPVWTTSDEAIVKVEADETGMTAKLTAVADGTAAVTVTVGDAKVDIPVTVGDNSGTTPPTTNPGGTAVASAIEVSSQYSKGKPITDNTLKVGEKVTYTAKVTPSTVTGKVTWRCDTEDALEIVELDETGLKVKITCVGAKGYVHVTASVDGVSYDFRIQCVKAAS